MITSPIGLGDDLASPATRPLKRGAMRSKDGSLHTDQSAALIVCAEDIPQDLRRRSLAEARHYSNPWVIFTRHSRWSVKSTNPPLGGFRIADELDFRSLRQRAGTVFSNCE